SCHEVVLSSRPAIRSSVESSTTFTVTNRVLPIAMGRMEFLLFPPRAAAPNQSGHESAQLTTYLSLIISFRLLFLVTEGWAGEESPILSRRMPVVVTSVSKNRN